MRLAKRNESFDHAVREFMPEAVEQNGELFDHAARELITNREQDGESFFFAAPCGLQDPREFMLEDREAGRTKFVCGIRWPSRSS